MLLFTGHGISRIVSGTCLSYLSMFRTVHVPPTDRQQAENVHGFEPPVSGRETQTEASAAKCGRDRFLRRS